MKRPYRYVKCACVTRWLVDFRDDRGEQPVPPISAALASGVGLPVRLASISTTPMIPLTCLGLRYAGEVEYVAKSCPVCKWPTKIARSEASCA